LSTRERKRRHLQEGIWSVSIKKKGGKKKGMGEKGHRPIQMHS